MIIIRYRILDPNDDYSFGKGQQNITYGKYAVAQAVKTRLKLLKAEWWENKEDGLPLFQEILGKSGIDGNITIVDSMIRERIIGTQDVVAIKNFNSTYENRAYSFSCTVTTKYGDIALEKTNL